MGHPILMGRQTFESIGGPLPGRTVVVVSRNPQYRAAGCIVANSVEDAIDACRHHREIFIIGGATLFEQTLHLAHRIYLTEIQADIEGDSYFPVFSEIDWTASQRQAYPADEANPFSYHFVIYDRNPPK